MGTVNVVLEEDTRLNLILGQQLENAVTEVVFDFSAWQTTYGSGTLALSVQRPGDEMPYAVTLTTSGTDATWSVTNLDTAYKGVGHIQLTYTVGSAIKKSVVYKFTVYESLGANGEYPSPGQTWQEEMEQEIADVKADLKLQLEYVNNGEHIVTDIEQGNTSSGNPVDSNNRLRTGLYEVKTGDVISFVEGTNIHNIIAQNYNSSGVWQNEWSGWKTTSETTVNFDGFVRLVFRRNSSNGNVTPSDYDAVTKIKKNVANFAEIQEQITDNKNTVDSVLDVATVMPTNRIDPNSVTVGRYLYNGTMDSSDDYRTSDFIAVENGDLLRFYKKEVSAQYGDIATRVTGERLALFDANKSYLGVSGQYPVNATSGYTVSNASAKYIRISYAKNLIPVALTVNEAIDEWVDYVSPYDESERLLSIEKQIGYIPQQIIDCWGDSRTAMNVGTSFTDYLATLLGSDYIVQNKGKSGQASGAVSARYGSNELYLTMTDNVIPASGSVTVTDLKCTTGFVENMETSDTSKGIRGSINGVEGTLIWQRTGTKSFTRDVSGIAVDVFPVTKFIPDPYFEKSHMQILWCGKNDFPYSWPHTYDGIISNYNGMVSKIPHDKFIILGETYSNTESYEPGGSSRETVDNINSYLADKYPNNYIDILDELVTNGLTLEEITPTAQDEADIANGFIPSSLMADTVHPNQYGREAIAKIIYAWMQTKGWI